MKMRARDVAWLLPLFMTGCFFHKQHRPQVVSLAPASNAEPRPVLTHPDLPASVAIIPELPLARVSNVEPEPVPPARHKRPAKPAQQAANTPPPPAENPGVPAIGQLSSGEPYDMRRETEDSIAVTERGLNGLGNLSEQDQKTAAQIRENLKQAREALVSGDVDGAHNLAVKAKAVLSELIH
ncbi:MAG TPA: hypothetical protein VMQ56_02995 [Terracidiphilus sp.]|jgi:hypothetical protein|nr:hypothetical protein [Terracidiphilus sp.]